MKKRNGFSLVELIIVVAIIGILVALISPAIGRAKEKAQSTVCASNMRQLVLGIMMYSDDQTSVLPSAANFSVESDLRGRLVDDYIGNVHIKNTILKSVRKV